MKVYDVMQLINKKLANELMSQTELISYADSVIDDINAQLNSIFPTFSEVVKEAGVNNPDYDFFPDKYIRSVVVLGAAYKYYEVDEEGNPAAESFKLEYNQQLFYMLRDYSFSIPKEYRADNQGFIELSDKDLGTPGLRLGNLDIF